MTLKKELIKEAVIMAEKGEDWQKIEGDLQELHKSRLVKAGYELGSEELHEFLINDIVSEAEEIAADNYEKELLEY